MKNDLRLRAWARWWEVSYSIARRELTSLVLLLLLASSVWAFVEIADAVIEEEAHSVDTAILLSLRSQDDPADPLGPPRLEEIVRDFTALGSGAVLTLVTLAVAGFLALQQRIRSMVLLLVATGAGAMLSSLLKLGFDRPRPELVPHETLVYSASFPSGHSMMSAVVYLTLGALLARVQPGIRIKAYILSLALLLTLLVGVSRVYLGVHWPSDVVAGWTAGAAWALLWWLVARWTQSHGQLD